MVTNDDIPCFSADALDDVLESEEGKDDWHMELLTVARGAMKDGLDDLTTIQEFVGEQLTDPYCPDRRARINTGHKLLFGIGKAEALCRLS